MQRTGLVRISSMTAVCAAPRGCRNVVLSAIGEPPWKTHLLYVCKHTSKHPRLKAYERGGMRALMQCVECGQKVGNFIPVAGVSEPWDSELEDRVRRDFESARSEWEKRRIAAYESANGQVNREWWAAYDRYLKSAVWAIKRDRVLERCDGVCEACGERRAEQVHHKKYPDVFGLEPLFDLAAVCIQCHKIIHPHME